DRSPRVSRRGRVRGRPRPGDRCPAQRQAGRRESARAGGRRSGAREQEGAARAGRADPRRSDGTASRGRQEPPRGGHSRRRGRRRGARDHAAGFRMPVCGWAPSGRITSDCRLEGTGRADPLRPPAPSPGDASRRSARRSVALRMSEGRWIGKAVRRVEDARLLTGRGAYIDEHPPVANACHAAIVRSPFPHAAIRGYDLSAALALDGVVGAITGADVARHTKPFSVGVTAPIHYYCAATDRVRFVGEPVAAVVARNRYIAEDAAELVRVDYDPLPVVVDPERALDAAAPVLHAAVGSNLAGNRRLVYGEPDRAFREADVVLTERFTFPKYGSTPIETYGVIARWDPLDGVCTV